MLINVLLTHGQCARDKMLPRRKHKSDKVKAWNTIKGKCEEWTNQYYAVQGDDIAGTIVYRVVSIQNQVLLSFLFEKLKMTSCSLS